MKVWGVPKKTLAIGCFNFKSKKGKNGHFKDLSSWIPFYCQACLRCLAQIWNAMHFKLCTLVHKTLLGKRLVK